MSSPDDRKPGTHTMLLGREALAQTALSVVLSAAVAFGVASYTASRGRASDETPREQRKASDERRRVPVSEPSTSRWATPYRGWSHASVRVFVPRASYFERAAISTRAQS